MIKEKPTPRIDINYRGETVICTMSEGITPYEFVVLLKHFSDKAVEFGYWLELDVSH